MRETVSSALCRGRYGKRAASRQHRGNCHESDGCIAAGHRHRADVRPERGHPSYEQPLCAGRRRCGRGAADRPVHQRRERVRIVAAAHRWVRAVGRSGYQSCALRRRYHLWQAIRADARARGSGVSAAQLRVSIRLSAAGHLPRHADDQRVLRGHVVSGPGRAV